ncbi:Trp biosynthesis-associated membrane protein [Salinibacterium sp. NSLL150]|uniref:Trp biosynthesis-associated membrane protein n=1 Tax=unclassified Salinibacterium TaxID=2632331 RepID=UPI0018CCABBA|nr:MULTISPECIES: Trp biosynthesis-associated membrane protein [unclassified Salinibacterium]MBH0099088.1 Trp biosynthesis-associated membrane protein [Salinibacterium sp. NSLL35]MBH0101842.1 Trp biosynthesis-associated membrane protein [Salinibacterium sp. NSLL150]MBH0104602.1 Trp biosynthesis-associated membrane protein [Salinibacterium sp. NSLL16]MBH0107362.1 Trp biosynthesis-associated membrane protein [Salinibacterium sp. NSLL17]
MIWKRSRSIVLSSLVLLGAVVMLSWTQRWFTITLQDEVSVEVLGSDVAGALAALALSTFALVAALGIASVTVRRVLGVIAAIVGAIIVAVSQATLADPARAASELITEATGISGIDSIRSLVVAVDGSAWSFTALVAGVLIIAIGIAAAVSARHWPTATKKYDRTTTVIADDPASQWDAQSRGLDPTEG